MELRTTIPDCLLVSFPLCIENYVEDNNQEVIKGNFDLYIEAVCFTFIFVFMMMVVVGWVGCSTAFGFTDNKDMNNNQGPIDFRECSSLNVKYLTVNTSEQWAPAMDLNKIRST